MRRALCLLLASSVGASCGGPELLIDTTPPVLIPNGGSAQAGQVDGPTAIPITGDGAIHPAPVAEAPVTPAPPPLTVMDEAALEATRAGDADADDADDAAEGEDADADDEESDDAARGSDTADAVQPAAVNVAPAVVPQPVALAASRPIRADGYAFTVPAEWENIDPTGLGSLLILSAHRSMDPGDGFYTNVIVSAEPFPGDTPSYATLNVPSLLEAGAALRDSETMAPTKRHRGYVDVEAYWLNVTGAPYLTLQRYLTTGQVGFVVTCAAAASAFEEERATCLDILDSFRE